MVDKRKEHLLSSPKYNIDSESYINSWSCRLNQTPLQSRILKDYKDLCQNPIANIVVAPRHSSALQSWNLLFIRKTLFEDEIFEANMILPINYPSGLPFVRVTSDIFHPNINSAGILNMDFLEDLSENTNCNLNHNKKTLKAILVAIQVCLTFQDKKLTKYCYLSKSTAKVVFQNSSDEYMQQAKEWLDKRRQMNSISQPTHNNVLPQSSVTAAKRKLEIGPTTFSKSEPTTSKREKLSTIANMSKKNYLSAPRYTTERLLKDWKILCGEAPMGITGHPSEENICIWHVTIPSPIGTPLKANLLFNEKYPFEAPEMKFTTKVFHPNVDKSGKVCLRNSDWTPAHTVWSLLASVQCLIAEPNADDYIDGVARDMFLNNPAMYHTIALGHFQQNDFKHVENNEDSVEETLEEQLFFQIQVEQTFKCLQ